MSMNGIQSLDRGLEILKTLSEMGQATASSLALKLGIHQSSASRLLLSLQRAGLVRKPDFHSFAPDFGLLAFAGAAMLGFPEVGVCASLCGDLARSNSCGAAAATLFRGRLLYLAWVSPDSPTSFKLVDDSDFPLHKSSLGLLLAFRLGRERAVELFEASLAKSGGETPEPSASGLFDQVGESLARDGVLSLRGGANAFNYALDFKTPSGRFAYALFSKDGRLPVELAKASLLEAIAKSDSAFSERGFGGGV
jgi:DNA-binding IclR family transcriptional regulator